MDDNEESGLLVPIQSASTPSIKSDKNLLDTLSRIRNKRTETDKVMEPSASTTSLGSNLADSSMNDNERRKALQKIREKRTNADMSASIGSLRSSTKQGPRSPLKPAKTMRSSLKSNISEGNEDDEDIDDEENENEEETIEEYVPIMKLENADAVFPISFLPNDRSTENELQYVVFRPLGSKSMRSFPKTCKKGISIICNCYECCGPSESFSAKNRQYQEKDFITMMDHFHQTQWINSQKVSASELIMFSEILNKQLIQQTSEIDHPVTTSTPNENDENEESEFLYQERSDRNDGIYNATAPRLTSMLLEGEATSPYISKFTVANIELSRATQRILRDLMGSIEVERIRQAWKSMATSPYNEKKIHNKFSTIKSDDKELNDVDSEKQHTNISSQVSVPGEVHLLKYLSSVPMLKVIEDPTLCTSSQPLFPSANIAYGGHLGHWGVDSNANDRLGPLPKGLNTRRDRLRAKFRLHVHQLMITDHPLMSPEERKLIDLKSLYAQYRSLFEQKTLEHLTQRLLSLIRQLEKSVNSQLFEDARDSTTVAANDDNFKDELVLLKGVYRDLIETLPALNELNSAVDILSSSIYEQWREIQELRRVNSGISNTSANLSVRKVNSNLMAPDEASHDDDTTLFWDHFKNSLLNTPQLLQRAQNIIFTEESKASEVQESDPNLSPRDNDQQLAIKIEEERQMKQKALSHVIDVMKKAVQTLINNNGLIPQYALRLTEDGPITPDNQLPIDEAKRRVYLRNLKFKVVLKINGKVITTTDYKPLLLPSMSIPFNQFFEFRIIHQLNDISLDLYTSQPDSWSKRDAFLANIVIPFPGQTHSQREGMKEGGVAIKTESTSGNQQYAAHSYRPTSGWYSFVSNLTTGYKNAMKSIGYSDDLINNPHRTEGSILCTTEYDMCLLDSRNPYEPIRYDELTLLPAPKQTTHSGSISAESQKAYDFTRENDFQALLPNLEDIDSNDPLNDHLLYLKSKREINDNKLVFRSLGADYAVPFTSEDGFSYANYVRFKETPRMKLLQLRSLKPYLFQDPIPLNELMIKSSELYKNIFLAEINEKMARIGKEEDDFDAPMANTSKESVNKTKMTNFLQRVRSSQTASSRTKKKKKFTTSSVVVETNYLDLFEETEAFDYFARVRRLHPKPKVREPVSIQVDKCELLVQIVGAKNIPLRSETTSVESLLLSSRVVGSTDVRSSRAMSLTAGDNANASSSGGGDTMSDHPIVSEHMLDERRTKEKRRARTFVEVRFQEHSVSTIAMDGGAPLWRQSISLPFHAPQNDFSPDSLNQVRDMVYFTLFDEIIEDDSERGGLLDGENPIRVEKRFLGSFAVPFETIYNEGRIEGVFRIDTPTMNFGYDHTTSKTTASDINEGGMFSDESGDANNQNAASDSMIPFTLDGIFNTFLECLVAASNVQKPSQYDSLYLNGSYIHRNAQSEFAYYAMDDTVTYIKVMITLDPILITSPTISDEITLSTVYREDRGIAAYARTWLRDIKSTNQKTAERPFKLFGTDSKGFNILICRYLTPQEPPKGYDSRRACIHLVSTIPFMKDSQSFIGELDLWCNSKEFWEIGAGDEEEHAVQLFNYLYYLSMKGRTITSNDAVIDSSELLKESVFLVLAKAIPEGDTVYVMLRDHTRTETSANPWGPENFLLINPCTGYIYSAMDPNCPVRDIQMLATPNNIWANLQMLERPAELDYNLVNIHNWRPFFGHRFSLPSGGLTSIQPDFSYFETSPGYALEVEKALFQSIRNSIRRWRSRRHRSTTTFHPDACNIMHELLPKLENWKRSGNVERATSDNQPEPNKDNYSALIELQALTRDKMRQLLKTRTLRGFPINMSFTDTDEILTKIKTLCIHEAKHPDVQFVLAVRACPLFNNILSVWIFLGTLEPTRL